MGMNKYSIIILAMMAGFVRGFDFADFVNDLHSDLAPVLALFGEKVAMQYISQAMGPLDCIALALAPLGIITIMVSAIRVGGPTVLKAIVGRAKENIAAAELELMSSTSREVCELFNGENIVRCLGSGSVWQYICLFRKGAGNGKVEFMTLQEATGNGLLIEKRGTALAGKMDKTRHMLTNVTGKTDKKAQDDARSPQGRNREGESTASTTGTRMVSTKQTSLQRIRRRLWKSGPRETDIETGSSCPEQGLSHATQQPEQLQQSAVIVIYDVVPEAPNISLNLQHVGHQKAIWAAVIIGMFLQTAVLVFFGLIEYNPKVQAFLKIDKPLPPYGFGMALGGTLLMAIGIFFCAHVVERSTSEDVYRPNDQFDMRLYWLQQDQTVNDQVFQSFATFSDRSCTSFLKSRRARTSQDDGTANSLQAITLIGVVCSLVGFLAQFIGFRGFHPAAPLAQLVAILMMTVCRAVVRPGFTENFGTAKLPHGFEQDWLIQRLAQQLAQSMGDGNKEQCAWSIVTGRDAEYRTLEEMHTETLREDMSNHALYPEAQRLLVMRRDLCKLVKPRTASFKCAAKLATAMEKALGVLFPDGPRGGLGFRWVLDVAMEGATQSVWIDLRFDQGDKGVWRVAAEDLHAVLSLWLYTTRVQEDRENGSGHVDDEDGARLRRDVCKPSLKALGEGNYDVRGQVIQDLKVWTTQSHLSLREIEATWESARAAESEPHTRPGPRAAETDGSLVELYASDLLFSFMWSMARTLQVRVRSKVEVDTKYGTSEVAPRDINRLQDIAVADLINAFRVASCWSEHETCLGVISPLSIMHKLPIPHVWFTIISRTIKDSLKLRDSVLIKEAWEQAFMWASGRIQVGDSRGTMDRVAAWLLEQFHDFHDAEERAYKIPRLERTATGRPMRILEDLIKKSSGENMPGNPFASMPVFRGGPSRQATIFLKRMKKMYELQGREMKFEFHETLPRPELPAWFDFTTLHEKATRGTLSNNEDINNQRIFVNVQDVCGWTPLHYAASSKNEDMVWTLLRMGADPRLTDFRGYTAAHHACLSGCLGTLKKVLFPVFKADMAARTMNGLTTMHLAAAKGHDDIVAFLLRMREGGWLAIMKDFDGRTAAHWAAAGGHGRVLEMLADGMDVQECHGLTPLHIAVLAGHKHLISTLHGLSAEGEVKDAKGFTPLILACFLGKWEVIQELVDAGAKVDAVDSQGRTALHHMTDKRVNKRANPALFSTLTKGLDPIAISRLIQTKDKDGRTPVDLARMNEDLAMAHKLTEAGASVDVDSTD